MSETNLMSEEQKNLLHRVEILLSPLKQIADMQKQKAEKSMPLKKAELQLKNSKGFDNLLGAGVGFCFLGMMIMSVFANNNLSLILGVFIGIVITVIYSKTIRKHMIARKTEAVDLIKESINKIDERIFDIACSIKNDVIILPPDYQYYFAADFIYSCLRNRRVSNMKEAINLYEDQLHKWKMEKYQKKLIIIHQQKASLNQIRRLAR